MTAVGDQAFADRGSAGFGGGGADDGGALGGQQIGDGGANATAGTGDQCDFTCRGLLMMFSSDGAVPHRAACSGHRYGRQEQEGQADHASRAASKSPAWPADGRRWPCRCA